MAQPSSRTELVDYCKRQLGAPVLEINIADEQVEDLVDDAVQFFQERHFDGVYPALFKYKLTQDDIDRGTSQPGKADAVGITTSTATQDFDGSTQTFTWNENGNYLKVPNNIIGVTTTTIAQFSDTDFNGFFADVLVQDDITKELNYGEVIVDFDGTNIFYAETYVDALNVSSMGKIKCFRITDGKGIGVVLQLSNGKEQWFFEDEIDLLDENGNVIKKNNDKKENSNFIFDFLRGLNYENKNKVSELLNPINFFIWLVVSFKDIF